MASSRVVQAVADWNIYLALSTCKKARQVERGRTLAFKELVCSWKMRRAHMIIRQDQQTIRREGQKRAMRNLEEEGKKIPSS